MKTVNQILDNAIQTRINEQIEKTEDFHKALKNVEDYLVKTVDEIKKFEDVDFSKENVDKIYELLDDLEDSIDEMKETFE